MSCFPKKWLPVSVRGVCPGVPVPPRGQWESNRLNDLQETVELRGTGWGSLEIPWAPKDSDSSTPLPTFSGLLGAGSSDPQLLLSVGSFQGPGISNLLGPPLHLRRHLHQRPLGACLQSLQKLHTAMPQLFSATSPDLQNQYLLSDSYT